MPPRLPAPALPACGTLHTAGPPRLPAPALPACRTLHTAEPADHLKWVTQQWIARGYGKPKGAPKAAASKGRAGKAEAPAAGVVLEQEVLTVPVGAAGGSQGKKQKGGKKGGGGGGSRGFG